MEFFQLANALEAGLWFVIAAAFAGSAFRKRDGRTRTDAIVLAATFALFGISDIVETQTCAWWRPWWLLVWKTLCVLVFFGYAVRHFRTKRGGSRE
ncbi:MAG: hypothetical protein AB7N71_03290 [Phycisphaerae bacterium]